MNNEPKICICKTGGTPRGIPNGNDWPDAVITESCPTVPTTTAVSIRKKVLFVGWGRTGKDEAAQFAELHLGLRYGGSFSWHAKEYVAAKLGLHPQSAYDTRHARRKEWYDLCNEMRADNITILAERALATGDICAGLRDKPELEAVVSKGLFDCIVWVVRPGTPEDPTVTYSLADVIRLGGTVVANSGTLPEYHQNLIYFFLWLNQPLRLSKYAQSLITEPMARHFSHLLTHAD